MIESRCEEESMLPISNMALVGMVIRNLIDQGYIVLTYFCTVAKFNGHNVTMHDITFYSQTLQCFFHSVAPLLRALNIMSDALKNV